MCTVFLSAVRRALPQAQVAVDLFQEAPTGDHTPQPEA
jgi:hypothetical protein